ncbi:MAG TPA: DUF2059 domain-containing protein [Allosphingosinicella sp.]|nr:DUF2059 domain-containing protein [Allosphingosinicella sp.]
MRLPLACLLLGLAPDALAAQPAPPAPAPAAAPPAPARAIDPARLAAAERLVALVAPPEVMQRMLGMPFGAMEVAMDMTPDQLGVGEMMGLGAEDRGRTIAELVATRDPHFRERVEIRNRVTQEVLVEVMRGAMPDVYRTMAEFYAANLTLEELNGAVAYYSTPGGRRFASAAVNIMQDPAFERLMTTLGPQFVQAMATIEERVRAASAHLPPDPLAATAADAETETE